MILKKSFKYLFSGKYEFLISLVIGFSTAGFVYLGFLQRHFFSYRYLFYAFLIAGIGTLAAGWLNKNYFFPKYSSLSKSNKSFTIASSLFLSIILLLNSEIQPTYYLLPYSRLEIDFTINKIPENEEGVRLLWIETGQGYVPYTYIDYKGEWNRVFGNTIFPSEQTVSLVWEGKVGKKSEIAFRKTNFDQLIKITWNGNQTAYNLKNLDTEDILIQDEFEIPKIYFIPFVLSFIISIFYFLLFLLIFLGSFKMKQRKKPKNKKYNWLLFMLPMFVAWFFALLILWPGVLTNDSLTIWDQAVQGNIDDWQSAFYTFILSVLIGINQSPAFILTIQIVLFTLVSAWGLLALGEYGVPRLVLWIISILMAFFPPNLIYSITLWKDIPYAISLLLLTIILLRISLSNGEWCKKPHNWIGLGIAGFLVSIFRQNGGPVALFSLLILPVIFRKYWKQYTGGLLVAVLLFFLVKGPFYDLVINVNEREGQPNLIYLHHISAHIDAGTEMTKTEEEYLDGFLPLSNWDYSCCYVGTISYDPEFERKSFLSNTTENRNLAIRLFLRDPSVDISHAFCSGELSYKFLNTQQCQHMKSLHGFISTQAGREDWIGEQNDTGIHENSFFPNFVRLFIDVLRPFGIFDSNLVIYLRPAFWLFVAFISIAVIAIRWDDTRLLLPIIPALSQSFLLFLIGFAPAFRYYYSNCLVGIILLGCIFIPKDENAQ